jgi:hypothetical protein
VRKEVAEDAPKCDLGLLHLRQRMSDVLQRYFLLYCYVNQIDQAIALPARSQPRISYFHSEKFPFNIQLIVDRWQKLQFSGQTVHQQINSVEISISVAEQVKEDSSSFGPHDSNQARTFTAAKNTPWQIYAN